MTTENPQKRKRPPRKHNPAWADPKEARAARQAKRRAALNDLARAYGYETWDKLATAALAGEIVIVKAAVPPVAPQPEGMSPDTAPAAES